MRKKALAWWNNLGENVLGRIIDQGAFTTKYHSADRKPSTLTGREIEEIYRKERLTVKFTDYQNKQNWCNGVMGDYWFEAKQFDVGSDFGINEGRVSKLHITHDGADVVCYDRGWDVKASPQHRTAYKNILKALEEAPKRWV